MTELVGEGEVGPWDLPDARVEVKQLLLVGVVARAEPCDLVGLGVDGGEVAAEVVAAVDPEEDDASVSVAVWRRGKPSGGDGEYPVVDIFAMLLEITSTRRLCALMPVAAISRALIRVSFPG